MTIRLSEQETIVGAWAESPSGPGWSNRLYWVCIYDRSTNRHRIDALQPDEMTAPLLHLHAIAAITTRDVMAWLGAMEAEGQIKRGHK